MELLTSEFSPFGRKCHVLAIEIGLMDRVKISDIVTSPVAHNSAVVANNPLGKSRFWCSTMGALSTTAA